MNDAAVLKIALAAVLSEARDMGLDVEAICSKAKDGVCDSGKRYRLGSSANYVTPVREAIEEALKIANSQI